MFEGKTLPNEQLTRSLSHPLLHKSVEEQIALSRRDTEALIAALDEIRPLSPILLEDLRDYARLVEQRP